VDERLINYIKRDKFAEWLADTLVDSIVEYCLEKTAPDKAEMIKCVSGFMEGEDAVEQALKFIWKQGAGWWISNDIIDWVEWMPDNARNKLHALFRKYMDEYLSFAESASVEEIFY
jgi:hypothetical protein